MEKERAMRLGWNMDRLNRFRRDLINREAEANGVYLGQHRVLRYIANHPGCSQRDIASALSQSPAAITLSTKRLQELGLITKETENNNLRQYHLYITDKGIRNGESFLKVIEDYIDRTFEGMSEEELEMLEFLVEKMYRNLEPFKKTVFQDRQEEEKK